MNFFASAFKLQEINLPAANCNVVAGSADDPHVAIHSSLIHVNS